MQAARYGRDGRRYRGEPGVSGSRPASPRATGLLSGSPGAGKGGRTGEALPSPPPGCRGLSLGSLALRTAVPAAKEELGASQRGRERGRHVEGPGGSVPLEPGGATGDPSARLFPVPVLAVREEGLPSVELVKSYAGTIGTTLLY